MFFVWAQAEREDHDPAAREAHARKQAQRRERDRARRAAKKAAKEGGEPVGGTRAHDGGGVGPGGGVVYRGAPAELRAAQGGGERTVRAREQWGEGWRGTVRPRQPACVCGGAWATNAAVPEACPCAGLQGGRRVSAGAGGGATGGGAPPGLPSFGGPSGGGGGGPQGLPLTCSLPPQVMAAARRPVRGAASGALPEQWESTRSCSARPSRAPLSSHGWGGSF